MKVAKKVLFGKETILWVDDENMVIDVRTSILEKMQYKAMVARGGKEAINNYKNSRQEISLVILDMIMPDMGGG